jgi:hypothetical protein
VVVILGKSKKFGNSEINLLIKEVFPEHTGPTIMSNLSRLASFDKNA